MLKVILIIAMIIGLMVIAGWVFGYIGGCILLLLKLLRKTPIWAKLPSGLREILGDLPTWKSANEFPDLSEETDEKEAEKT